MYTLCGMRWGDKLFARVRMPLPDGTKPLSEPLLTYHLLPSVRSNDYHMKAISQEIPQPPITEINFEITYLKLIVHSDLTGINKLTFSLLLAATVDACAVWACLWLCSAAGQGIRGGGSAAERGRRKCPWPQPLQLYCETGGLCAIQEWDKCPGQHEQYLRRWVIASAFVERIEMKQGVCCCLWCCETW